MFSFVLSLFRSMTPANCKKASSDLGTPSESKLLPESKFIVEVTETGIINHRPEGKTEAVLFSDLAAVIIETNDTGPWGSDVWWLLLGKDLQSGCVYPGGATGEREALIALQHLPGFDNEALIQAMGSCNNAKFLCWRQEWSVQPKACQHHSQEPKET